MYCGRQLPLLQHTSLVSGKPDAHWGLHDVLPQHTSSGKGGQACLLWATLLQHKLVEWPGRQLCFCRLMLDPTATFGGHRSHIASRLVQVGRRVLLLTASTVGTCADFAVAILFSQTYVPGQVNLPYGASIASVVLVSIACARSVSPAALRTACS